MRSNAFGFLVLCTGVLVLGCGSDSSACTEGQFLCDGMCIDECAVGRVECDCVCIPAIDPVLGGAQGIQENIFSGPGATGSCTASSCHGTQNPQQMLELSSAPVSAENLIDVDSEQAPGKNRVTPSDVAASYLYDKLTNQNIAPGTDPMPQVGFPLCDAKIAAVEAWIAAGAP